MQIAFDHSEQTDFVCEVQSIQRVQKYCLCFSLCCCCAPTKKKQQKFTFVCAYAQTLFIYIHQTSIEKRTLTDQSASPSCTFGSFLLTRP